MVVPQRRKNTIDASTFVRPPLLINNKVVFTNHLLYRLFLSLSLLTSPAPACKITFNTSIRLRTSPFLPLHIRLIYGPFISIVPPSCTSVTLAPIDSGKMYVLLSVIDPRAKCKITCLEFSTNEDSIDIMKPQLPSSYLQYLEYQFTIFYTLIYYILPIPMCCAQKIFTRVYNYCHWQCHA